LFSRRSTLGSTTPPTTGGAAALRRNRGVGEASAGHEAEQAADQEIADGRRAGLLHDVRRIEERRLQALRTEARRNELSEDLHSLGVNLACPFRAARLTTDFDDVLVHARGQVGSMGQAQRLLDVLLDDAAVRKSLDSRGEATRGPPAQCQVRLCGVAVGLQQRPHAADRETEQQAGGHRPERSRDSLQLRAHD